MKKTVKIVGIVVAMLIAILALGSCSTDKSVPETKEEFWAEINELESSAETVFEEIILNGSIENKDVERINNIQDNLERICNSAHTKSYYGEVSDFVDCYKPSFIVTIDKNWNGTKYDLYSFENSILEFEGAKGAILLKNAEGPVFKLNETDDFDGMFDIEKKYNVINAKKDAYILARGLESGYTLYIIKPSSTKLSSSSTSEAPVSETYSAFNSNSAPATSSDKTVLIVSLVAFSLTFVFLFCFFIAEKNKIVLIFAIIALIGSVISGWALYLICTV